MTEKTGDKRVRRTRRLLREALLRLMEAEPVGRISTTRLCAEADINRNTFYAHYSSPEEVLQELEDELLEELVSVAPASMNEREAQVEVFRHYAKHRETYRTLIQSPSSGIIRREMSVILDRYGLPQEMPPSKGDAMEWMFLRYSMMGAMALIESWIESGNDMSPEELAEIARLFSQRGLSGITSMHEA